jgi:hypothetical protein
VSVQPEDQLRRRSAARRAAMDGIQHLLGALVDFDAHDFDRFEAAMGAAHSGLGQVVSDLCQRGGLS